MDNWAPTLIRSPRGHLSSGSLTFFVNALGTTRALVIILRRRFKLLAVMMLLLVEDRTWQGSKPKKVPKTAENSESALSLLSSGNPLHLKMKVL